MEVVMVWRYRSPVAVRPPPPRPHTIGSRPSILLSITIPTSAPLALRHAVRLRGWLSGPSGLRVQFLASL